MRFKWLVFPLVALVAIGLLWGYPRHFGRTVVTHDAERHLITIERFGFPNVTRSSLRYIAIYDQNGIVFEERAYISSGSFLPKQGVSIVRRGDRIIFAALLLEKAKAPHVFDGAYLENPSYAHTKASFGRVFDDIKATLNADKHVRDIVSRPELPPGK